MCREKVGAERRLPEINTKDSFTGIRGGSLPHRTAEDSTLPRKNGAAIQI